MQLTKQQQDVLNFVATGSGSAIVVAVAGSGKTFTLIEAVKQMSGQIAFAAYNKKIAVEIEAKIEKSGVRNAKVGTFHSFGFQAWRKVAPKVQIEGKDARSAGYLKMDRICEELSVAKELRTFVAKAVSFAKQRALGFLVSAESHEAWLDIVAHFDLADEFANENGEMPDNLDDLIEDGIIMAKRALRRGVEIAREIIDFDDMIYMPLVGQCQVWQYDWVLVDEAQDTNPARRALAKKMLKAGGRALFVGDPAQAIYGFTGADATSLQLIKSDFNAIELPLTCSFRCPTSVVSFVQQWVSHIHSAPGADEGMVAFIEESELLAESKRLTKDDAILCRNTKPLVSLAFTLLRSGIACHVEGRDIAAGLIKLVNRWKRVRTLNELLKNLEAYAEKEGAKAMAKGQEMRAESINDTVGVLAVIIENLPSTATVEDLKAKVNSMFLDSTGGYAQTLTLSTIHKSKGREWARVFWYGANRYQPSRFARQTWQMEQEVNLMYVAGTRAMETLVNVNVPAKAPASRAAKAA